MLPFVTDPVDRPALVFGDRSLSYRGLASAASRLAADLPAGGRVAVWAVPTPETCVAVTAAVLAGAAAVPLNPRSGERESAHVIGDSAPDLLLAPPGAEPPEVVRDLPRIDVDASPAPAVAPFVREVDDEATALIVYTSGTTGAPKGVPLSRRAIVSTLDALAEVWSWTADDVLVHALPLFHVHGLVLGVLGPLRRGGTLRHPGRFEVAAITEALSGGGTLLFGVPTMYHRLALAVDEDPALVEALAGARLLVSGSAALPRPDHDRLTAATGHRVIERYGMSETLMNTSVRPGDGSRPGGVGTPLPGVGLRLVEEDGTPMPPGDPEAVGEIQVRGPNLFDGYLNRPEATAEAMTSDGWFRTGDMAVREADGSVRIVGRRSTDLIKSAGYKIGAGEIENVLLAHPAVAEAAVTGEPDPDLGERVVAWVVPRGQAPSLAELSDLVAAELAPHKRPRRLRVVDSLPRNDMGKVLKRALGS
ncbi:acyl-CoA synthetase [Nocardiopsis sp. N85]|uniref:acyl-CoA synthetase n=1 Tax=Nocardiopsis sp. N85 TaxID=3029400 RepID=UPI00237FB6DF|nr:acyl-CoA synthetase [Nocardiopsis sp. N85]MDE3724603.1 acyl-CoA synthetase [Nocardiopsis sp. N85]